MTDKEFQTAISLLSKGDKGALRQIYEAYIRFIYAVVYDTVKRREDAEDITSEFFIKLVRVAGTYKKGTSHRAWMAAIAKNMAIDALRKSNREILESAFTDDDTGENSYIDNKSSQATNEASVEDKAILSEDMKNAMGTLNDNEREIIDLKLLGGLKFKEIAHMLGQPMGTVTWLYNQGIKKLRRCLSDYERE